MSNMIGYNYEGINSTTYIFIVVQNSRLWPKDYLFVPSIFNTSLFVSHIEIRLYKPFQTFQKNSVQENKGAYNHDLGHYSSGMVTVTVSDPRTVICKIIRCKACSETPH